MALEIVLNNPNISREAGRYASSSEGIGAAKQYTMGLLSPAFIYLSAGKIFNHFTLGTEVKAKKLWANKIEFVATPRPGVNGAQTPADLPGRSVHHDWLGKKVARIGSEPQ